MIWEKFLADEAGSPSAEFALALPIMLPLIFIAMEAGNFMWSEQKLLQSVRDGARYAGRLNYGQLCPTIATASSDNVKNLTRSGTFSPSAPSKLPGLTNANITVTANCAAFVGTGIYTSYGSNGAVITVSAKLTYHSLLGTMGLSNPSLKLAANANSPVIGI